MSIFFQGLSRPCGHPGMHAVTPNKKGMFYAASNHAV